MRTTELKKEVFEWISGLYKDMALTEKRKMTQDDYMQKKMKRYLREVPSHYIVVFEMRGKLMMLERFPEHNYYTKIDGDIYDDLNSSVYIAMIVKHEII